MADIQQQMEELAAIPCYTDAENRLDFEAKLRDLLRDFLEECCERLQTEKENIISLEKDNANKPANERNWYIYQQALVFIHVYEMAIEKIRRHFAGLEK